VFGDEDVEENIWPTRVEVTGGWRRPQNEESHDVFFTRCY
jgi:uncharacterized protein YbdZ (MbtH family)